MHRTFFAFAATIERALRLFGLDVHVQLDDSRQGPFAFERRVHGLDREYWGLGLHIVIGPLRPPKKPSWAA